MTCFGGGANGLGTVARGPRPPRRGARPFAEIKIFREITMSSSKLMSFNEFFQHHDLKPSFVLEDGQILERSQQIQTLSSTDSNSLTNIFFVKLQCSLLDFCNLTSFSKVIQNSI